YPVQIEAVRVALFRKVIFTVAVSLQPAVREQLILPLCKLHHNILYASRIIRRTVQLPAETGKHDEVAVRIDEPRAQILPFQVQDSFILDRSRLRVSLPY